jgi:DnaJ-class molecular chaperone
VNLKYTYKIPLRESLCGTVVQVPTLEGKKVGINCTGEVLKPTTTKRLQGYGLPLPKDPTKRGDLIVSFDVLFPDQLSQSSKDIIYDVLS